MELEVINGFNPDGTPNKRAAELDPRKIEWPEGTLAVVVKDEKGSVKGFSAIILLPHIEGTWLDPEYRHTMAAAQLVKKVEDTLRENGGTHVWAFAHDMDMEVKRYLERFHYERLPFTVYMKQLEKQ